MDIKNILIIANIRCGGTYLMKSLGKTYNLKEVWEPKILHPYNKPIVVKANAAMHSVKALVEYSKHFSQVILLDRKDKKAQLESAVHMFTNNGVINVKWKWKKDSYSESIINESKERIKLHTIWLEEISKVLNKPIYYYEDIYYSGKKLTGLHFNPDLSKKLRIKSQKKNSNLVVS